MATQPVLHGMVLQSITWAKQLLMVWSQSKEDHATLRAEALLTSQEETQHPYCKGSPPLLREAGICLSQLVEHLNMSLLPSKPRSVMAA